MIEFQRFTLDNGLRVLVHEDHNTAMACVNILYDVGARDESPDKTGFAHLFEHLMFGGSVNVPNYDAPLQEVGGENNAFTSNDITNYYITLPSANLETAFWLESDRMLGLAFSEQSLDVQRSVVSEEFKQRYLNQPYGDVWLRLRPLAYKVHPYRWATIGKELKHIEEATMTDVRAFFDKYYIPNNAILVVAGDVQSEEVKRLANKWFGDIPARNKTVRDIPQEPKQTEARREEVHADVPVDSIYIAFHGPDRLSPDYAAMDLMSDILSRGNSSRLYRALVKDQPLFSEVNAYVTGSIDSNLFVVEGKPLSHVPMQQAEELLWNQLNLLKQQPVKSFELEKVKNKIESTMVFAELSILDKAMNLAFYEVLGDARLYNDEVNKYLAVTGEDIQRLANDIFVSGNSSTLVYYAKENKHVE
ncbi:putative Zn-dependent peptidase [Sphingobacterium allocomposti]|jgi:zinc protease|uniref:Putative Zn-dependent peptidase n=1 Tax=Sphingobacterium allocomposti TaxID=415956 RepID=A0A5S5DJG2_9SPHI|nr:pitrilysin family protein [Sphingobacterium composti Yoo et al. 2007 non Ten et al. 2007]TYP95754.1 putative Zn-dependent peptidase [Sphingobacterium composti Yoo et al. 2007 non Ten et al. 2007]HLS96167.1 pitrilysin family protein [Sphingobacterium sp.]